MAARRAVRVAAPRPACRRARARGAAAAPPSGSRSKLDELLGQLQLERLEENLFRGTSQDLGWGRVFGGQILGQALFAASHTVPAGRAAHSFNGYFLRPGDVSRPVVYDVDRIRDGGSFTTRRVIAIQGGRPIFNMAASFHVDEAGYDHQADAPGGLPEPEELLPGHERALRVKERLPPSIAEVWCRPDMPIEIREVDPPADERRAPRNSVWMRASGPVPDDPAVHRALLAYASDFQFLITALRPHGVSWLSRKVQMASIDHAMWFHRPFRADEWLLYSIDSPTAQGGRGLVRGQVFTRAGVLVASTAQEGLMRDMRGAEGRGATTKWRGEAWKTPADAAPA